MDQNLEPKVDPPYRKIKAKRVKPEEHGVYFLGASSKNSFVGYIRNGMTEEEIQEYIKVQEQLAPPGMKERKLRSEAVAENANTDAEGLFHPLARGLESASDAEDAKGVQGEEGDEAPS